MINRGRKKNQIEKELKALKDKNLYRFLKEPEGVDFCSNDYLSLSSQPEIGKPLIKALKKALPLGAGSSRLIRGHTSFHKKIETKLERFIEREAVLIFSSGYLANVGVLSLLCKKALIFSDEFNHASLIDGMRLSGGKICIYPHRDMSYLKRKLERAKSQLQKVIVTESLFSMEGDFAPLETLIDLAKNHSAFLFVDEAHATGVFGERGRGCLSQFLFKNSSNEILSLHTFGKAFGSQGAFLACSKILKEHLINHCRAFIFTTAPSPVLLKLWETSLKWVQSKETERKVLQEKSSFFRQELRKMGFVTTSESQIVPLILGENKKTLHWAEQLQKKGFDVRAIRYPTVPKKTARLRICLHSKHKKKDLCSLLEVLKNLKASSLK